MPFAAVGISKPTSRNAGELFSDELVRIVNPRGEEEKQYNLVIAVNIFAF